MSLLGIFLYFALLILQPQEFIPFFLNTTLVSWIVPLTFLAGLFETWVKPRSERIYWLPQHTFLLLFLLFVFLSNALNGNSAKGVEQFTLYLKRVTVYGMVFLALHSRARIQTAFVWMIILITMLAMAGIYQGVTGIGLAGQPLAEGRIRWVGDWDGSNGLCLLFVLATIGSIEFGFGPYARGGAWIWASTALAFLLPGIYFTNSRGGWLSLGTVLILFLMERYRKYFFRMLFGVALVVGLLIAVAPSRMGEVNTKEESAHERLWSWEQGLWFLQENPLRGIGKGMYGPRSDEGLLAHNNYIQVAAEVGGLGYFVWLTILYLSLKGCLLIGRQGETASPHAPLMTLARGMFLAMIGFSVVTFFITMELDILFVLWGFCAALLREGLIQFPSLAPSLRLTRRDTAAIVGGGMGLLGVLHILVNG